MKHALFLAVFACFLSLGCGQKAAVPEATETVAEAPSLPSDEQVLRTLEAYDPIYQVNSKGRIIKLKLPWRHLPNPILLEINKLTELEQLDLYASTLTDEGLGLLKDLQKLRNMGLGSTFLTDEGLARLKNLRSLHHVWLSKQKVSEEAVTKLKEERPDLSVHLQ